MKSHVGSWLVVAMIPVGLLLGAALAAEEEAALPAEEDQFIESAYFPPTGVRTDELLRSMLHLRQELRTFRPTGVVVWPPPRPPVPPKPVKPTLVTKDEEGDRALEAGWTHVLADHVAGDAELARLLYKAGKFPEAAALYREVIRKAPDNASATLMLALCERNMGHDEEARTLLKEAAARDEGLKGWVDWELEMMDIEAATEEGGP